MATVTAQLFEDDIDGNGTSWAERLGSIHTSAFDNDPWSHNRHPFESPPTNLGEVMDEVDHSDKNVVLMTVGNGPVQPVSQTLASINKQFHHFDDYDNRFHLSVLTQLSPSQVQANQGDLDLGNVIGAQTRALEMWVLASLSINFNLLMVDPGAPTSMQFSLPLGSSPPLSSLC